MTRKIVIWAATLGAFAGAHSAGAHHSGYAYATTPIWVKGSVVRFEHVNPHTLITLEDRSDGQVRLWAIEGPPQAALDRSGTNLEIPKIGDVLTFCGFPYKSAAELARIWPGVDFSTRQWSERTEGSAPRFVAGHVIVEPDGKKRVWEPHGLIGACIGSSDEPRSSWLDFLNADPGARDAWCEQRKYKAVQSDAALSKLVAEIDSSLAEPCK